MITVQFAASNSDTSQPHFYELLSLWLHYAPLKRPYAYTTRRRILKDCILLSRRLEDVKFHSVVR